MYLDSAILVKLIVREADTAFYADLVDGQCDIWTSELAITECWSALCRKAEKGWIDNATRDTAWRWFETYLAGGGLRLQPVTGAILRLANRMIEQCQREHPIRTLDAIHLASCEFRAAFPLQTTDRVMRSAADMLRIGLGPLPS